MNRQWKLNLGLLGLIALLIAVSFLRPGIAPPKPIVAVTDLDLQSVQKLRIEQPARPAIVLRKLNGEWQITEPLQAPADLFRVNEVLRAAHSQSLNQLPYQAQTDAGKFGLEAPKATVYYDKLVIKFGDTSPLNQQQYLLVENTLHLVSANTLWSVNRPANDYIERRLLKQKTGPDRIRFADGNTLRLTNGSWHLKNPVVDLTSDALTQIANEWRYATALKVTTEEPETRSGIIEIRFPGEKGQVDLVNIEVVSYTPDLVLYRRDEGLLYYFPADLARRLIPPGNQR